MMLWAVIIGYLAVLLVIGVLSARRGSASAEDYFLAGRSFGTVVLFMSLFGTNVTAFALLGLPGLAYHKGVGVFGFFGVSAAFWGPLMFILLGYPIWKFGKSGGYMTPTQMFQDRWQSPAVGAVVLILMLAYTVPYIVIGIMGGGMAIEELSHRALSYEAAAVLVTAVTVCYTTMGGMRGTAWTNVFQGSVFLIFLVVACAAIAAQFGGPEALHARLVSERPQLLQNNFPPGIWASGFLVGPVSIIAFPHMFMRLLAGRDATALRRTIKIYPWALMLLFLPVTLIGVWGALVAPGFEGRDSDYVLPVLVEAYLPNWLSAVGLAAILAAVMSSLDGQMLTISTLLSIDVFHHAEPRVGRQWGRACVVLVALLALIAACCRYDAIFNISKYAFSGYTLIIPIMAAAFYWQRSTAAGIVAGSVAGHLLLLLYHLPSGWRTAMHLPLPDLHVFPVAVCLVVEVVTLVGVSYLTHPPSRTAIRAFQDPLGTPT